MIAVTFAVPHESRDLRRAMRHASHVGEANGLLGTLGTHEILVVHTGIGTAAAEGKVRALLAESHPQWLLSAGYAGALDPDVVHGEVIVARNFSAPELLGRCHARSVVMATQDSAAETMEDKAALARETGAQAVDMETAGIARVAREHRLPMLALRAISDASDESIPVPLELSYDLARQRPRVAPLLKFLAGNPRKIPPFLRFVTGLPAVRAALTDAIVEAVTGDRG